MNEQVSVVSENEAVEVQPQKKARKVFRVSFLMAVMSALLSLSAFAEDGAGLASVTGSFSTVLDMVTQVFNAIVGNPILVVFLAAALLRVGIGLFRSLRHAAR